jgi:neutral amino acid transport system permease protein
LRHLKAVQFALGLAVLFVALAGGVAHAQDSATSLGGTMFRVDDAGDRQPVPDVRFTVRQGGQVIGTATTGKDGTWRVPVPGPGTYQVELDVKTLPKGVGLRDPERAVLDRVDVRAGQAKVVLFPLGQVASGGSHLSEAFDRLADLAANGIKVGAIVALAAIGLSLIFGVTGLVNFAHGELVTIGAVATWYLNAGGPGLPLWLAAIGGVGAGCLTGFILERGLFGPLRKRRMSNVALMVVSIGLSQFLRHTILLFFGGGRRRYTDYTVQRSTNIGPIAMQPKDIVITGLAFAVLLAVAYLLRATKLGTAMRAVADNRDLAESSGIDVQHIILVTWITGAGLAAFGGVLYGTSQTVSWDMGFVLLLSMFAAVVLGGLGSAYGAMVGGLVIGLVSELSTYWFETEFKYVAGLAVLILVLLIRPQGILGIKERVG